MGQAWTADEIVGTNCANIRRAAGLSQRELARDMKAAGFPWERDTVSQIETARRRLGLDELAALAAYFELPPQALLRMPLGKEAYIHAFARTRGSKWVEVAFGEGVLAPETWGELWSEWDWWNRPAPKNHRDAVDSIFRGVKRPWSRLWRRKKGHPRAAYEKAREELLSQRTKHPGPIFLADEPNRVDTAIDPWGGVTIPLEPGVPYVARDEVEAQELNDLVERAEGKVRRITRAQAHYIRQKQKRKGGK
jgi:transcriptional regulator with XRE-family HTH domain